MKWINLGSFGLWCLCW